MASNSVSVLSYRESLEGDVRRRYDEKTSEIGEDPYILKKEDFVVNDRDKWPEVTNFDIIEFFIFKESSYTRDQLRNHKSLDAYKYFQDGWVQEILHKVYDGGQHLMKAKVNHSMRIREKPLEPWVIFSTDKVIQSAHCTCMAGLGECCSHVGAMLFAMEQSSKALDKTSVTDEPAYWLFPSRAKFDTPYKRVKEMDFQSAAKKRKSDLSSIPEEKTPVPETIPSPTKNEEDTFYNELFKINPKSAVLSLTDNFCNEFEPSITKTSMEIEKYFDCANKDIERTYEEMVSDCESIGSKITISDEEIIYIEKQTKKQSKSSSWHKLRCGRITASNLYSVCHTNVNKPSLSLLKKITRNSNEKLACAATDWGVKKEQIARDQYEKESSHKHSKFKVSLCGLFISKDYYQLAASPDGILECECCGKGMLEIKCPYSMKDKQTLDVKYLVKDDKGNLKLSTSHPYYYQVQLQLYVTKSDFCDFVVWWPCGMFSERILKDKDLLNEMIPKALDFHKMCVLPELVFGYFSGKNILKTNLDTNTNSQSTDNRKYCVCGGHDDGTSMVMCDNENCQKIWYHMRCVNMRRAPKGKWFCSECKK